MPDELKRPYKFGKISPIAQSCLVTLRQCLCVLQ
jgi:hypothetical protein